VDGRDPEQALPGFLETQEELLSNAATNRPFAFCLEGWIDACVFGFAKQGGWFHAIAYYAIREPRYQELLNLLLTTRASVAIGVVMVDLSVASLSLMVRTND
jgi:hypothetical protein